MFKCTLYGALWKETKVTCYEDQKIIKKTKNKNLIIIEAIKLDPVNNVVGLHADVKF